MVCPNCGYNNQVNNRFCVRCGVDISAPPGPDTTSFETGAPSVPPGPPPPPAGAASSSPPPAAPNPWGAPPPANASPGAPPPPPSYPPPAYAPPSYSPPPPPGPYGNPPTASAPPNPFAPPSAYPPPPGSGPYAPYPYPQAGYQAPPTNGLAIASLILSIVGWLPCGVGSIVAVVLGFVARGQIRQAQGRQGGDGLALAGIILGFVGIALVLFIIIVGVASGSNSSTG